MAVNFLRATATRVPFLRFGHCIQSRCISYAAPEYKNSPLAQFFPDKTVYDNLDVGRAWLPRDLRIKSYEDLQKLWFVLLKEHNMLLTIKHECVRLEREMPRPDRIRKVRSGLEAIRIVIGERERALEAAMDQDPETVSKLRAEAGVKEPAPVERKPMSDAESKSLFGVDYPTRANKPHQPRRPLKRAERSAFRAELVVQRKQAERADKGVIREEVQALPDEALMEVVKEVRAQQAAGAIYPDFSVRSRLAMHEAARRGLDKGLRRV